MSNFEAAEWDLPRDIISSIFKRASTKTVARCSCISRAWKSAANDNLDLKRKAHEENPWRFQAIEPKMHDLYWGFETYHCDREDDLVAMGGRLCADVFDMHSRKAMRCGLEVSCLCLSGGMLFVGDHNGIIYGWELMTQKLSLHQKALKGSVLAIKGTKESLIVGGTNGYLSVWRKADWVCERVFYGPKKSVTCVAVSKERGVLISGSGDSRVRLWDLAKGFLIRVLVGHGEGVTCVACSEEIVFSGSSDMTIRMWGLEKGECLGVLVGHHDIIISLDFDSDRIVSCSFNGIVKMWDVDDGACFRTFFLDTWCASGGVSVKGDKVAIVLKDGRIYEWDFSKGK